MRLSEQFLECILYCNVHYTVALQITDLLRAEHKTYKMFYPEDKSTPATGSTILLPDIMG
jgi:hypothetical protein